MKPQIVTITMDAYPLLIAAATAVATCEEVLAGNTDVAPELRRRSAEAFARAADTVITSVSEALAKQAHVATEGDGWTGKPEDRPWRHAFESERGTTLATLAANSPEAVALIRELNQGKVDG